MDNIYHQYWQQELMYQLASADRCRKRAYICSPFRADTREQREKNLRTARAYMFYANKKMNMNAAAPHAYLPLLLCDEIPAERAIALRFGLELLEQSDVMLVCGNKLSNGMRGEIAKAALLAQAGGTPHENATVMPERETEEEYTVEPTAPPQRELTFEEKVEQAMRVPCPITKYGGKTLGDVLQMDPKAIQWCATKFTGGEEIRNAAKLICEYAQQKASA